MRYLALLRGVNVGGKTLIRMAELVESVAGLGYDDVTTYIASGNLLFSTAKRPARTLEREVESAIDARFHLGVKVTVRDRRQMEAVVARIPSEWIGDATKRVSVAFLLAGLDARTASRALKPKDGIDELAIAPGALLLATNRAALARTGLKLVGTPLYKQLTIRSLNTTLKLAELLGGASVAPAV